MRHDRPDPSTEVGQLLAALQALRKGSGLTRTKVARELTLVELPVVKAESARLNAIAEEVAYNLVIATVHGLKDARSRDVLISALALDNTPPGSGLTDRRRRFAHLMDESRVRDHEDEALEEVARWLLGMTNPEVLFGDFMSGASTFPAPEWQLGTLSAPVGVDDLHPREELVWDYLEKATILDEQGFSIRAATQGIVRAAIDGVTGYTLHHTANTDCPPTGIHVIQGGKPGRKHRQGALRTVRMNIDFPEPLMKNQTLRLHWVLSLDPGPTAMPTNGMAVAPEVPTRDLALVAQFDEQRLPVSPCYYISEPDYLPEPSGSQRPLKLQPGNVVRKTWTRPERQKLYVIAWTWSDEL